MFRISKNFRVFRNLDIFQNLRLGPDFGPKIKPHSMWVFRNLGLLNYSQTSLSWSLARNFIFSNFKLPSHPCGGWHLELFCQEETHRLSALFMQSIEESASLPVLIPLLLPLTARCCRVMLLASGSETRNMGTLDWWRARKAKGYERRVWMELD